MEFPASIDS